MDLTVLATPFYYASMAAEHRWLKAHHNDPAYDAGQFERRDTTANLTMAHLSVIVPFVNKRLRKHLELGKGRAAVPVLAASAAAAVTTLAADALARRRRRNSPIDLRHQAEPGPVRVDRVADIAERVAGVAAVTTIATSGIVLTSTWSSKLAAQRLWDRRITDLGEGVTGWAVAIIGWDFIYYWNHRLMHECRVMWAIHVPHHSSERYNLSVALRQPVSDSLGLFLPYGIMSLFGVRPKMIETSRAINLIYQYWVHTETIPKLGPFEGPMNTPSHHRVHHGSNPQYIDRNHGGILIAWDKAFGTFEREDDKVVYGLTKNLDSFNPVTIIGREYAEIVRDVMGSRTWRDRLSFVFRGPGWAYDRHRARAHTQGIS